VTEVLEWRVRYRRSGWKPGSGAKLVRFYRREAADAYAAKLCSGGRPDLSPLEYVHVEHRRVSRWEEQHDQPQAQPDQPAEEATT
jgi:hypothetical protein